MELTDAILFHLSANIDMAKDIAKKLNIHLGTVDVKRFDDGEIYVAPLESVRNKNIYILQSTCPPVTETLMEVLVFIDALKRASARSINLISPYFGYSRQDRKSKPREPITARLVADLLQVAGAHRVVMFDLHTPQLQGFFNIPVDNVTAIPTFASYLETVFPLDNLIIVSPDHGGVGRVKALASLLHVPFAIIDKRRNKNQKVEIINIVGDIKGKTVILLDDIIDTANTLIESTSAVINAGALSVYACATHGLFSFDALEKINNSPVCKVFITNSIPKLQNNPKIEVLSINHLLIKIIKAIEEGTPVTEIYSNV